MTHPSLIPSGIRGMLLGLRGTVVYVYVREVSLTLVNFSFFYIYKCMLLHL